ncbi:type II toxin-antitoxin system RelE/ParE family toxin [bacterium]|nr:type II toxin-antitoxin system RelE/ParE family toxin [bacterium]MCI0616690.1 type II toxin-antitoxin system RelE/ParE family toxin [bacterium]
MKWTVEVFSEAEKSYNKLPRNLRERIHGALTELEASDDPRLHRQVIPLVGKLKRFYRMRVGDYRVIFEILAHRKVIAVHSILPRGKAYR